MDGFTQEVSLIIEAAAKSPLGILSLAITALSIIAFHFFKNEGWIIKLPVFLFLFLGVSAIGYAVIQNIPENQNNVSKKNEVRATPTNITQVSSAKAPENKSIQAEPLATVSISKSVDDKLKDKWATRFGTKWEK